MARRQCGKLLGYLSRKCCLLAHVLQGGPKSGATKFDDPHHWLTSPKTPQAISTIFGTLQCLFILQTPVDLKFIEFIKQSGVTWRKLITWGRPFR